MTLENINQVPWLRDTLPNMLWLCSLIADYDEITGMQLAMRALDVVDDTFTELVQGERDVNRTVIDGLLTSFEHIPVKIRSEILDRLRSSGLYEKVISKAMAHSLAMYPRAPGQWLISPSLADGLSADRELAEQHLTKVIEMSAHGQGRIPTRAKFIVMCRHSKAGRIVAPSDEFSDITELLSRYPGRLSDEEVHQAGSIIRSMFLVCVAEFESKEGVGKGVEWARTFWRSNWQIYPCRADSIDANESSGADEIAKARDTLIQEVQGLHKQFLAIAQQTDPDLYNPDRYEVLTGITYRALRVAYAGAVMPVLWSGEHGAPVVRILIETLIVLRWLVKRNEETMYAGFKEYGRGHLKLLKLHFEDFIDTLDGSDENLEAFVRYLSAEVNQDVDEEWQNISINSTFAGMSTRKMAIDVGMEAEYRLIFAPASSATHGEWTSLDRYVLQRCNNPLHGGHRIPRTILWTPIGPSLIETCLGLVKKLVDEYTNAMRSQYSGNYSMLESR